MVSEPAEPSAKRSWLIAGASVRGASHVREGLPNQDALAALHPAPAAGGLPVAVAVADGHGAARHFRSGTGSRFAAEAAVAIVTEASVRMDTAAEDELSRIVGEELPARIVERWNEQTRSHLRQEPITGEEWRGLELAEGGTAVDAVRADPLLAYGATLLCAFVTERLIVLLQLGDGDILAVAEDGTTTRPVPADARLDGNLTTSICRPGAESDFRSAILPFATAPVSLLLLSTDGYANSFRTDADFLKVGGDFLRLFRERGSAAVEAQLPDILDHASQEGSGDDITLGLFYRAGGASADPAADARPSLAQAESAEVRGLRAKLVTTNRKADQLRAAVLGIALAGVAVAAWMNRDHLLAKPASPFTENPQPAPAARPDGEAVPDSPEAPGKPGAAPLPVTAAGAALAVEKIRAVHSERGIEVRLKLAATADPPAKCVVEASAMGPGGRKLAGPVSQDLTWTKDQNQMQVELLIPYPSKAKRANAMRENGTTVSARTSCGGKLLAKTEALVRPS